MGARQMGSKQMSSGQRSQTKQSRKNGTGITTVYIEIKICF